MVLVAFTAGEEGEWSVTSVAPVTGDPLPTAPQLAVREGPAAAAALGGTHPSAAAWALAGVTSNLRYTTRDELKQLAPVSEGLGRPAATRAALIPIKKSAAWWALSQDERLSIISTSQHVAIGLKVLPAVSRRLHHCRDLGLGPGDEAPPFDFLTWFEYAPQHEAEFEEMVKQLRASDEWRYVEREVDIRLERVIAAAG